MMLSRADWMLPLSAARSETTSVPPPRLLSLVANARRRSI
jgi:hypothetical protein